MTFKDILWVIMLNTQTNFFSYNSPSHNSVGKLTYLSFRCTSQKTYFPDRSSARQGIQNETIASQSYILTLEIYAQLSN